MHLRRTAAVGATSWWGMDETCEKFHAARQQMIAAFAELTTAAWRAGVDEDVVHALHARFFDGNVEIKEAFWVAAALARIFQPHRP